MTMYIFTYLRNIYPSKNHFPSHISTTTVPQKTPRSRIVGEESEREIKPISPTVPLALPPYQFISTTNQRNSHFLQAFPSAPGGNPCREKEEEEKEEKTGEEGKKTNSPAPRHIIAKAASTTFSLALRITSLNINSCAINSTKPV